MSDEMDEIWELYADDGGQALDSMEQALEALQDGTDDQGPHVAALFRAVHTFKGNSRVLGLATVESRAHLAEDLIGLVRDDGAELTGEILNVLFHVADQLRAMLDQTASHRADVDPAPSEPLMTELRRQIDAIRSGTVGVVTMIPALAALDGLDDPAEAEAPATEPEPEPEPQPAPKAKPKAKKAAPAPQAAPEPEPEPQAVAAPPAAPAREAAPQTAPEPAPAAAPSRLADPQYRKIFSDMVEATLSALTAMADDPQPAAFAKAENLRYASAQLGLPEWEAALAAFVAGRDAPVTAPALAALLDRLQDLARRDLGLGTQAAASEPVPEPVEAAPVASGEGDGWDGLRAALRELPEVLSRLSELGLVIGTSGSKPEAELRTLHDDILNLFAPLGFVGVVEAASALLRPETLQAEGYRAALLNLYEQAALVERGIPQDLILDDTLRPSVILQTWCADRVFDTLQSLRLGLDGAARRTGRQWFPAFESLMRQAYHASAHFQMETAGQLAMALIDLFARARIAGDAPDVILVQMARGFVDTMELVFDALDQGEPPDTERIERLFEEAANATFAASGVATARSIEQKLNLPREFHRVLSPEGVKKAQAAIEAGLRFYVLRADLNADDALAEAFINWLSLGRVTMITNATVFQGDVTLFDFLIASNLAEPALAESLADLDPTARSLSIREALAIVTDTAVPQADPPMAADLGGLSEAALDSLRLLEAIGEISTGQSIVATMINELASADLMQDVVYALRQAGLPPLAPAVRGVLREVLDRHLSRLRQVDEAETQLSAQLGELQEQSVAMRSRPAQALLGPLATYVAATSRQMGHEARLTSDGGEVMLDQLVIEDLRGMLKRLVRDRMEAKPAARRFHLAISREEDHVSVVLTDDGGPAAATGVIPAIASELGARRGLLRSVPLPDGGLRVYLNLPLQMIVLEGMVVRVGHVHYVLPIEAIQRIHQSEQVFQVSAAGDRRMLSLDGGTVLPVRPLPRVGDTASTGAGTAPHGGQIYVIVRTGGTGMAIPVDELLGQQLVLLRPLEGVLAGMRDMTGVAILSGGEVGMVVAVSRLAAAA